MKTDIGPNRADAQSLNALFQDQAKQGFISKGDHGSFPRTFPPGRDWGESALPKLLRLVLLLLVAVLGTISSGRCASWSGRIVDADTGSPIQGTVVVRSWDIQSASPAGRVFSLQGSVEGISNQYGEFHVSGPPLSFHVHLPFVEDLQENPAVVYKPGYVPVVGDSNMKVRQAATAGLGKTRSPKAVEPLLLCWSSLDPWLRKRATEALASIGPPAVIPLSKMLDHNDPYLRWKAVWVLGMINDDRTCRLIADMLRDPCKEVRWMAAKALGRKESDRAVPDLVELLEDHDPGIREIATESLFQITGQKFEPGVRR